MASRHQPAPLLIAVLALVCLEACHRTLTITPTFKDADADISTDVEAEDVIEDATDPVEEAEPDAGYEFNTCLGACALQLICLWDPLPADLCGAMCARLTSEKRACLNDALEAGSCYAMEDCIGELDPVCGTVCDFVWAFCDRHTLCHFYCPMYSDLPRECAMTAAGERDCGRTAECLVGHNFGATCHDACTMLIETCGVDADFDSCMGNCDFLDINSMSRACIDAAKYYRDCEALAACGGLVP